MHIHGGSSEYNSLTPKHSFTFSFNQNYGPNKLVYPAVSRHGTSGEFHDLVLRGNVLDSWANSETDFNHLIDGELRWYRSRASYVRDQWLRDSQIAQGQPAGHGRFVHLYLNGGYWGASIILDERLDEHFAAAHLGGNASEFDVIADQELRAGTSRHLEPTHVSGRRRSFGRGQLPAADVATTPPANWNPAFPVLLDLTNLVDYMILHIYAGADDWPWHNWGDRPRSRPQQHRLQIPLAWDQEISINSLKKQHTDTGQLYASADVRNSPAFVYSRCRANAEFRQFFADRVQHNLFPGGPLSVSNNIARYDARTAEIDHAMVAESARWGSFYRPAKPLPSRGGVAGHQLVDATGLFPVQPGDCAEALSGCRFVVVVGRPGL